ncbi:MAG: flavoprotein [Bdellovibrionales bacterium]
MSPSNSDNILLMVSGSIAAYKSLILLSQLRQEGHEVKVAVTNSALKFIGQASFEGLSSNKVYADEYESGHLMDHIHLMNWADKIILYPASANSINSFANGIVSNSLGSLFLAFDFKKPFFIAPAMNSKMWNHPSTKRSVKDLEAWGIKFIPPEDGQLACGEIGSGRLCSPERTKDILLGLKR